MNGKYELVKRYYDRKLWTKGQVEAAVKYGWITDTERDTILGTATTEGGADNE